jgi:hypothetical protein
MYASLLAKGVADFEFRKLKIVYANSQLNCTKLKSFSQVEKEIDNGGYFSDGQTIPARFIVILPLRYHHSNIFPTAKFQGRVTQEQMVVRRSLVLYKPTLSSSIFLCERKHCYQQ